MPLLIIYLIGLKGYISNDPIYYKILTPTNEFATASNTTGIWKEEFKYNTSSYDDDLIFELWTVKTHHQRFRADRTEAVKLSTFKLSSAGHSDTLFDSAKVHWYPISNLKNVKIGLKIGCAEKSKVDDLELQTRESALRSARMTEQIVNIAGTTNNKLATQNEKLLRAEANLDLIKDDIRESKREMRSIKSVKGQIQNHLTSSEYTHEPIAPITKQSHEPIIFSSQIQDSETDRLVSNIGENIKLIKEAALVMSDQLDTEQIDRMQDKTNKNNVSIKKLRSDIKKL